MANLKRAGALRDRLHFQQRTSVSDGFGNTLPGAGPYETRFTVMAAMRPLRGSEAVMASRLEGRQPYAVTVRAFAGLRDVTTDWRLVDARNINRVFDITSPLSDPDGEGKWLEFLVMEGGPTAGAVPVQTPPAITTEGPIATAEAEITIEGTADPYATVTVSAEGIDPMTVTTGASGGWSVTFEDLADGEHIFTAAQRVAHGPVSQESDALSVTVDRMLPEAPVIDTASPLVTTDTTPSISGTAEALSDVTIFLDGEEEAVTQADENGDWSWTFDELALGVYSVTATATDQAGNTGPSSAALSLTVGYSWMEGGEVYGADFNAGQYWREDASASLADNLATVRGSGATGINAAGTAKAFGNNAAVLLAGKGLDIWGPGRANKCQNYNANPPALLTPTTAAAFNAAIANMLATAASNGLTTFGVVDDPAAITAAGLSELCNGRVYYCDNSAGNTSARVEFVGPPGNLNTHALSIWWRAQTAGMQSQLRFQGGSGSTGNVSLTTTYQRSSAVGVANATTFNMYVNVNPGTIVYFILNQLEEGSIVFPPIVTAGAAATREASVETIPDFAALAAAAALGNGFDLRLKSNVSRISDPLARVLAAFGVDANNSCRVEIGTDNRVRAIMRKSGADVVSLASAALVAPPGLVEVRARFTPGDFLLAVTGLTGAASEAADALPALSTGRLGSALDGTKYLQGPIELATLKAAA